MVGPAAAEVALEAAAEVAPAAAEVGRGTNANQVNVWIANFSANLQDAFEQNNHKIAFQEQSIAADSCLRDRSNGLHINRLATSEIDGTAP